MPDVPFQLLIPITWPYFITDRFNAPRNYPFSPNKLQLHEGIDFAPKQPITETLYIRASQRGVVDKVGFSAQGYGNYVRIVHDWGGDRYVTWYGHMSQVLTAENHYVTAGEQIGIAGSTGNSTGTHVHLTLQHIGHGLKNYVVDDVVDPEPFLSNSLALFDEAWWVKDLTVEDGTTMKAGQPFRKTWRIRNAGSTPWGAGYTLSFFTDLPMGGPTSVPLPAAQPGAEVDVSVDLVAPNTPGRLRSTWKPRSASGKFFDYVQYAEIQVNPPVSVGTSEASYVDDVTIPDDTVMKPGQTFRKTWAIRNTGQTTWGSGYGLAFFADDQMGGPDSVPLPPTQPGQTTNVSVDLVAPNTSGTAKSTWKPRDPQGKFFEFAMYAQIVVAAVDLSDDAALVGAVTSAAPRRSVRPNLAGAQQRSNALGRGLHAVIHKRGCAGRGDQYSGHGRQAQCAGRSECDADCANRPRRLHGALAVAQSRRQAVWPAARSANRGEDVRW